MQSILNLTQQSANPSTGTTQESRQTDNFALDERAQADVATFDAVFQAASPVPITKAAQGKTELAQATDSDTDAPPDIDADDASSKPRDESGLNLPQSSKPNQTTALKAETLPLRTNAMANDVPETRVSLDMSKVSVLNLPANPPVTEGGATREMGHAIQPITSTSMPDAAVPKPNDAHQVGGKATEAKAVPLSSETPTQRMAASKSKIDSSLRSSTPAPAPSLPTENASGVNAHRYNLNGSFIAQAPLTEMSQNPKASEAALQDATQQLKTATSTQPAKPKPQLGYKSMSLQTPALYGRTTAAVASENVTANAQIGPKVLAGSGVFTIAPPLAPVPPLPEAKLNTAFASDIDPLTGLRADAATIQATQGTTPLTRTDMPQHLSRQIVEALQHMPNRPVGISLSPEELGRVRLALSSSESGIVVSVLAERPETMDLLRRHIASLETAFENIGYSDIAFSFFGDNPDQTGDSGETGSHQTSKTTINEIQHDAAAHQIDLTLAATVGLDIRL
ncbi:Flagellar hook-length control protein FliK [Sulfitobacter noctilucae]|uniref:flagellar hook-length control protein FliK n=1 Tax=Sulfitobacter noctilucae TaxID=1342302 RepID=UPI000469B522|nr:flagellar hook-length control protein FliK [Sulfitobacter noctilucae]KIN65911.1 Flagellar hook-length control protein FliK [Sulfitobacter noctilucae]